MLKILWITNYPSPYRVDFYSELGSYVELTVLFENSIEEQKHRNKNWFNKNYAAFNPIFLEKTKILGDKICLSVLKYCLGKEYDLIVLGDYSTPTSVFAALVMQFFGKKYVISIDGAYLRECNSIKGMLKRCIIKRAWFTLSSSNTSDEYLMHYGAEKESINRYNFTSLRKTDILTTPLSSSEKMRIKETLNIEGDVAVLLVGRFVQIKGIDFVIKMASQLPKNIQYYIAGDEPTKEYLEIIEQEKLENVHFIGFQKKEQLKQYYKACDLFVFPTRYDPWGLVVNEAMAYGMPIVSTDKSSAALHFITNGVNGYVYHVDDVNEYLHIMNNLYSNIELMNIMGGKNLEIIQDYTIEKMAEQHWDIFNKYVKRDS